MVRRGSVQTFLPLLTGPLAQMSLVVWSLSIYGKIPSNQGYAWRGDHWRAFLFQAEFRSTFDFVISVVLRLRSKNALRFESILFLDWAGFKFNFRSLSIQDMPCISSSRLSMLRKIKPEDKDMRRQICI
ncbi:hypothetical protein BDR04DRAFT_151829 [Suillus decipiens]|nr:hypothetical protein BDR04DRAFT_151829 [Suillus decipiens]